MKNTAREKVSGNRADSQVKADRRHVRSEYLAIVNLIRGERREDIASLNSDKFKSIMSEVEDLHQLVQKPREQVADAEALLDLAKTLLASVKILINGAVTPSDFVSSLQRDFPQTKGRTLISDSGTACCSIHWEEIGKAVSHVFKNFQGCRTMLGPMQTEVKKRKVAVYRRRGRQTTARSCPEKLAHSRAEERNDTDIIMSMMFKILKDKKRVMHESLILNRNSFAQTVENLFALSFLVKDGRVEMGIDNKDCHFVSPRNAPPANAVVSGEVTYNHFVFRYDFKDWKLMMDFLPVGEELMPHRDFINLSSSQGKTSPNDSRKPLCTTPTENPFKDRDMVKGCKRKLF